MILLFTCSILLECLNLGDLLSGSERAPSGADASNPGGRERQQECPANIRVAHGPKATEWGTEEAACKHSEAGGHAPDDPSFAPFRKQARTQEGVSVFYCLTGKSVIK